MITFRFIFVSCIPAALALDQEPLCLSRYDYDYKVLRNIVSLEQKLEELQKTVESKTNVISKQEQYIEQTVEELQKAIESQTGVITKQEQHIVLLEKSQKDILRQLEVKPQSTVLNSGSIYVHWGRTSCPDNGTEIVYTGYAAGSWYHHKGAAANNLCLPTDPLWGEYDDANQGAAFIYGAEYQVFGSYSNKLFKKDLGDNDIPCAVCRSVRTSVLMVPGRNACYDGWSLEYAGYLSAGHHGHNGASEYVCLDADPEFIAGRQTSKDGRLFYMVESKCGALPCPPYVEGRELTCVVCTL